MPQLALRPTHAPVRAYYKALDQFGKLHFDNEGNIRGAFEGLLKKCASQFRWTLVPEYQLTRPGRQQGNQAQHPLRLDAALIDEFHLPRGYWEAKDSKDDLALVRMLEHLPGRMPLKLIGKRFESVILRVLHFMYV